MLPYINTSYTNYSAFVFLPQRTDTLTPFIPHSKAQRGIPSGNFCSLQTPLREATNKLSVDDDEGKNHMTVLEVKRTFCPFSAC